MSKIALPQMRENSPDVSLSAALAALEVTSSKAEHEVSGSTVRQELTASIPESSCAAGN